MKIEFKGRLFGDVLRDIVYYASGNDTFTVVKSVGITNVQITNYMNHKAYPGIRNLTKISTLLPSEQRSEFIAYYHNPETNLEPLHALKLPGLFAYLNEDEKKIFKNEIIKYII